MKPCLKFFVIFLFIFTGCARLLPSSKNLVDSPWQDFNTAKQEYERIIPGKTTVDDLNKLNFNPYKVPNIRIMNVTEIIGVFLPNPSIKMQDLDPGIQKCIECRQRCTAYKIEPGTLDKKRVGNFWADLFSFKRHTIGTGWEMRGLITIVDGVVTYRDPAGGKPLIKTEEIDKKPLGPLQNFGDEVLSAGQKLW